MERLNNINCRILNEIAFRHTMYMSRWAVIMDQEYVRSLHWLRRLLEAQPKKDYETLLVFFANIKSEYGSISYTGITPGVGDCYILWGRMYVIAYFAFHDDNTWRKMVLPQMYEMMPITSIQTEMNIAAKQIDKFYKDKENWRKRLIEVEAPTAAELDEALEVMRLQTRIEELEEALKQKEEEIKAKDARIAELEKKEATVTSKALSGRPKTELFEDADDCQKEKELLLKYLKKHNLSSTLITCEKDSTILQTLAVFYWHWEKKYHFPKINTAAYYRFLHERCGLQFKIVEKSFGNVMGLILRHKQSFPDISGSVKEFIQRNSTQDIL